MCHMQVSLSLLLVLSTLIPIQCVQYPAQNNATGTLGGTRFDNEIGIPYTEQALQLASEFIWSTFKQGEADRKKVEILPLFIDVDARGNAAYTDIIKNEIHVGADYIGNVVGDVRIEITGVLYHEATHVWQWFANGEAPGGLIEGIADYVRLKSGWGRRSGWAQRGAGTRWDEGYVITAYFLEYCSDFRNDFVAELNGMMKFGYNDVYFEQLLGKTVDVLWNDYKALYSA